MRAQLSRVQSLWGELGACWVSPDLVSVSPESMMISGGVSASQNKWAGPPPGLHSDFQDSTFCLFLPGQDAGQGSGGATQGTMWGWNRRAGESPGQVSELDRTQLSQDLGGGTLAIDKLPDNGTRVVVSARGTQRGREVAVVGGWGPGAPCKLLRPTSVSFGVDPGGQCGERAPRGGPAWVRKS